MGTSYWTRRASIGSSSAAGDEQSEGDAGRRKELGGAWRFLPLRRPRNDDDFEGHDALIGKERFCCGIKGDIAKT